MSALDAIGAEIPDVAAALRLDLRAVLESSTLAVSERWGVAIAAALASRSRRLAEALIASRPEEVGTKTVEDALAAAALMGMSNIFHRFPHLLGKPSYQQRPAKLRMQRIALPSTTTAAFELFSLAVSVINACATCVRAHEAKLLQHGTTEAQIHDAVRVASVMHGVAVALEGASLIGEGGSG